MGPEAKIIHRIREAVKRAGGWSVKLSGNEQAAGLPDLVICLPADSGGADEPITAFVETKVPGAGPTTLQAATIQKIVAAGGLAFVAHSLEEVAARLARPDLLRSPRAKALAAPSPRPALAPRREADDSDGLPGVSLAAIAQ